MKNLFIIACSLFAGMAIVSSCTKDVAPESVNAASANEETRAYGDKTPKLFTYFEVNDINPLNATRYRMNNTGFIDAVILFAANINDNNGQPCLYLNDNVTEILVPKPNSTTTGHYKYVQPIRQTGTKVLLSILGNHQGVGFCNLSVAQQQNFARILADAVQNYQLDGIDFDDEWAKYGTNPRYPSSVSGSFSGLILDSRSSRRVRQTLPGRGKTYHDIPYRLRDFSFSTGSCGM